MPSEFGVFNLRPVFFKLQHLWKSPRELVRPQAVALDCWSFYFSRSGVSPELWHFSEFWTRGCWCCRSGATFWEPPQCFNRPRSHERTVGEEEKWLIGALTRRFLRTPMAITSCTLLLAINHVLLFDIFSLCLNAMYIFLLGWCLRTRQELRPVGGQPVGTRGGDLGPKGSRGRLAKQTRVSGCEKGELELDSSYLVRWRREETRRKTSHSEQCGKGRQASTRKVRG